VDSERHLNTSCVTTNAVGNDIHIFTPSLDNGRLCAIFAGLQQDIHLGGLASITGQAVHSNVEDLLGQCIGIFKIEGIGVGGDLVAAVDNGVFTENILSGFYFRVQFLGQFLQILANTDIICRGVGGVEGCIEEMSKIFSLSFHL
jgi:hypothetical protein